MGGKWEVSIWEQWWGSEEYSYKSFYLGNSLWEALAVFWVNRKGHGCVTLHYRGGLDK